MLKAALARRLARPRRLSAIAWLALPLLLLIAAYVLHANPSVDLEHRLEKMDFTNYWVGSKLILGGRAMELFSGQQTYFAALREFAGPDIGWHNWSYPPHYLFFIMPFGLFGYLPAAAVFLALTLCIYLHAVSLSAGGSRMLLLLLLLPAILGNVVFIQNGFLISALFVYGLTLRQSRPVLAGIALGMLTIKPQLGFLLPILLIFERRWTVMLSATATASIMIGLAALIWGPQAWVGYFTVNLPYQGDVMLHLTGIFTHMMPSVYGSLRALSVAPDTALLAHLPVALLSFIAYLICLRRTDGLQARATATVFATFMISPYSLIYDFCALAAVAALAVVSAVETGALNRRNGLLGLVPLFVVCLLPLLTLPLALAGLPVSPVIIAFGWFAAMRSTQTGNSRPFPPYTAEKNNGTV